MRSIAYTTEGRFDLHRPKTDTDWNAYHSIRERALWTGAKMASVFGAYNKNHPQQYANDYIPLIIARNDIIIGTIGLQDMGNQSYGREVEMRAVAIEPACQGQGYGGVMMMMAESAAAKAGFARAGVWSGDDVVLFYARHGFIHRPNDLPILLDCPVPGAIPMTKRLDLGIAQNDGSVLIAAA